jgi:hypothetical protein
MIVKEETKEKRNETKQAETNRNDSGELFDMNS